MAPRMSLDLDSLKKSLSRKECLVLSVGEEATVLTHISGNTARDAWVAAPDPADGMEDLTEALNGRKRKRLPIYILVDAFEQLFREEKVPKVGRFDQAKVIHRHLTMAFPGDSLRGALSHGHDPQGNQFFLFASVPMSGPVKAWLEALTALGRAPAGIHLLPLESLSILPLLAPGTEGKGVRWRMLFSFNMAGGLRQIVSKQNRLVLSRVSPPPPPDSPIDPVTILDRDFRQTLSYVKRMGYQQGDHLDVAVLAEEPFSSQLRQREWEAHSFTVYSPNDAGEILGLHKAGAPGSPYADVLHALWLATRQKPALTLSSGAHGQINYQRILENAAVPAALLAVVALVYQGVTMFEAWTNLRNQVSLAQSQLTITEMRRDNEVERLETLPYREADILPLITLLDVVSQDQLPTVPLFARLSRALDGGAILTTFELSVPERQEAAPQRRRAEQGEAPAAYTILLTVALSPEITEDQAALDATSALRDRLEKSLEGHVVTISRQPVDINPDQVIRGGFSQEQVAEAQANPRRRYSASYTVVPTAATAPSRPAGGEG